MSASEKLQALDEAMPNEWKRISPGAPLIEGPFANVQALCNLRNVLPQIRAVVEAAERYDDPQWPDPWNRMNAAVAALDEALTAGEK